MGRGDPLPVPARAERLALIRRILPDEASFRAWSNFEFRDAQGRWHEVDLLLLGRGELHLIELKYYSGLLRGDEHTWLRAGRPAESSPLKLARRKAQYFATKLRDELKAWAAQTGARTPDERDVVPYIQEAVFLHHPRMRCELSAANAINLYGPDGAEAASNLPGSSTPARSARFARQIADLQARLLVLAKDKTEQVYLATMPSALPDVRKGIRIKAS
ncbi:MAG: NERD domain-containing protein [Dermatophilaceae bacterium]